MKELISVVWYVAGIICFAQGNIPGLVWGGILTGMALFPAIRPIKGERLDA